MGSLFRGLGVLIGMALVIVCGGMVAFTIASSPLLSEKGQPLATAILAAGAIAGAVLVQWASPGFLGRVVLLPFAGLQSLFQASSFVHPVGLAIWTLLMGTLLLWVPVGPRMMIVLFGFIAYLVVAMVLLVAMPGWWFRALLTLLAGPVVMFGLIYIAEAFERNVVGEGSLALLGPLMMSWVAIPVTGLIRLALTRLSSPPRTSANP